MQVKWWRNTWCIVVHSSAGWGFQSIHKANLIPKCSWLKRTGISVYFLNGLDLNPKVEYQIHVPSMLYGTCQSQLLIKSWSGSIWIEASQLRKWIVFNIANVKKLGINNFCFSVWEIIENRSFFFLLHLLYCNFSWLPELMTSNSPWPQPQIKWYHVLLL